MDMKVSDVKKRVGKLLDGKLSEVAEWIDKAGHVSVPAGLHSGMSVSEVVKGIGDMKVGDVVKMVETLPRDHVSITIEEIEKQPAAADGSAAGYKLERIPEWVRDVNEEAYSPRYISIGPIHRGGPDNPLRRQDLKIAYMWRLMKNQPTEYQENAGLKPVNIKACFNDLKRQVDDTRRFYAPKFDDIDDDEWAMMLLLDGCFIITHLLDFTTGFKEPSTIHTKWVSAALKIDLVLLENQIPFSVLESIMSHIIGEELEGQASIILKNMVVYYWVRRVGSKHAVELIDLVENINTKVHHLVHLIYLAHYKMIYKDDENRNGKSKYKCVKLVVGIIHFICKMKNFICNILFMVIKVLSVPWYLCQPAAEEDEMIKKILKIMKKEEEEEEEEEMENIPSATELHNLGIHFSRKCLFGLQSQYDVHIRANDNDTMDIPQMMVSSSAAPLLHNLIAWEHVADNYNFTEGHFTKYAFLMYNLINSHDDIALLQGKGILLNNFGTDEEVVTYFKNLVLWNSRNPRNPNEKSCCEALQKHVKYFLPCKSRDKTGINEVLEVLKRRGKQSEYRFWAEVKKYFSSPLQVLLALTSFLLFVSSILPAISSVHITK